MLCKQYICVSRKVIWKFVRSSVEFTFQLLLSVDSVRIYRSCPFVNWQCLDVWRHIIQTPYRVWTRHPFLRTNLVLSLPPPHSLRADTTEGHLPPLTSVDIPRKYKKSQETDDSKQGSIYYVASHLFVFSPPAVDSNSRPGSRMPLDICVYLSGLARRNRDWFSFARYSVQISTEELLFCF